MAVGKFHFYDSGKLSVADSTFALDTGGDTVIGLLANNSYTPADTHTAYSQITNEIGTGVGYTRQTLGSQTMTQTAGTIKWKGNKMTFASTGTFTAQYCVLVQQGTGTGVTLNAGDKLIGYFKLDTTGTGVPCNAGAFEVRFAGVDGVGTIFSATGADADV